VPSPYGNLTLYGNVTLLDAEFTSGPNRGNTPAYAPDYQVKTGAIYRYKDIIKVAPEKYSSTVQYPNTPIARKLKGIAQVHIAEIGSRIFYCDHSTFDTHAGQNPGHGNLWTAVTEGVDAFFKDLREHNHADNVIMLMFSEFGRRVRDNGSGTDHGAAAPMFIVGSALKSGLLGQYPSLAPQDLFNGDLNYTVDFRSVYAGILEGWLNRRCEPILGRKFEPLQIVG